MNDDNPHIRENITVSVSLDNGVTFPVRLEHCSLRICIQIAALQ